MEAWARSAALLRRKSAAAWKQAHFNWTSPILAPSVPSFLPAEPCSDFTSRE